TRLVSDWSSDVCSSDLAKTEQGWQGRNRRSLEEKVGGKEGGRGEDGTSSRQESGGEESAGKGFTEGREEGGPQATESRRDSGTGHVSGGDRVAAAKSAGGSAGASRL